MNELEKINKIKPTINASHIPDEKSSSMMEDISQVKGISDEREKAIDSCYITVAQLLRDDRYARKKFSCVIFLR